MTDPAAAEMDVVPRKRSIWRNLSPVWLVPILAVVLALGVAWQNYSSRGTLIEITWTDAAGVTPNETALKYREVTVGMVEGVKFTPDLEKVIVSVRINKDVAATFSDDAKFWVVEPEVSARGISGLSTVLSGVYIEGAWTPASVPGELVSFTGLDEAPSVRPGERGTRVTLRATDSASISKGAPVLYRGLEVGRLETPRLSANGENVVVNAFIEYPHDQRLNTATRFWDTSGFSVALGPSGLELNVSSVATLVSGGIAFDTVLSGGDPLTDQTIFDLFTDEPSARASVFNKVGENSIVMSVLFSENLAGLSSGAPVEYRGLNVGEVTSLGAFIDDSSGSQVVRLRTNIVINPQALGLDDETDETATMAFLAGAVANGMRARLATTSLFSAALKIELVDLPDAPSQTVLDYDGSIPVMPSVPSDLPDFTATAEGLLQRINGLPVEEVMERAISLMSSIESLVSADSTREVPQGVLDTMAELRGLINDESIRAVPASVAALIEDARALVNDEATQGIPRETRDAIAELRILLEEFRTKGAIDALIAAVGAAEQASADVTSSVADVPALIADLRAVVSKVNDLKAEDLVDSATRLLDSVNVLVDNPDTRSIPPALTAALKEVQAALKELREGGAVENTNAALASARRAADAVATATEDLPALTARLNGLVSRAEDLVAAYGTGSSFNKETVDALREVRNAARAVAQLAKTIERKPNSLILGR